MQDSEPSLDNHEIRIYQLEQSNLETQSSIKDTQTSIKEVKDSMLVNQSQSSEQSRVVMSQNESLMRQNERLSIQMGNVFDTVTSTNEGEAKRSDEMKRLSVDTRMKLFSMVVGAGSIGYLVIDFVINLIGK